MDLSSTVYSVIMIMPFVVRTQLCLALNFHTRREKQIIMENISCIKRVHTQKLTVRMAGERSAKMIEIIFVPKSARSFR